MLAELLTELENYRARHDMALADPGANRFVLFSTEFTSQGSRRLVGGFADRLKGLLSCALLAILTDRSILVDWRTPAPLWEQFAAPKIDLAHLAALSGLDNAFVVDAIDNKNYSRFNAYIDEHEDIDRLFEGKQRADIHTNILSVRDLLRKRDFLSRSAFGRTLNGLLDVHPADVIERELLPLLFTYLLSYQPRRAAVEMWADFQSRRSQRTVVGVHFRSGGDGGWWDGPQDALENAPMVYAAIDRFAQRHAGDELEVLIASDSARFRADLMELVSPQYSAHGYSGPICHYERSSASPIEAVDFAIFEFMCLSRCAYVIHGAGGFGLTAALVGGRPHGAYRALP